MDTDMAEKSDSTQYKVLCGQCPDQQCKATLFFPAYDSSIECTSCGQRHEKKMIQNVAEVTNPEVAIHNILKNILLGTGKPKKCSDTVKVLGVSNFQCKLLSPLLTIYGMEKQTGEAKLLADMGQNRSFDCSVLGDRAFLIEPDHMEIIGYGRDKCGSSYLKDTINAIQKYNNNEERILPVHADGDGHCLVHALSRALIGRELFWHALRENLQEHFKSRLETYKAMFHDFVDKDEWTDIISECDPLYVPLDGEPMGLRNIHIFGLANVLRRPIILLDSISGLQSSGDYSGIFLPGLIEVEKCRSKDGQFNKPLVLAWSSSGRNHYIALVGVRGRGLPKLPPWMTPKTWGMPQSETSKYIEFDCDGAITLYGDKCLQDKYILRLVTAMEKVFLEMNEVSTSLVADVHQYVYKSTGMVGTKPEVVIEYTKNALRENRLYRCLTCDAVVEWKVPPEWLKCGGNLYKLAVDTHGPLDPQKSYSFPTHGLICSYDKDKDVLVANMKLSTLSACQWCQGIKIRQVTEDGSPMYENGDRTNVRTKSSRCHCGYKHFWDGKQYDNKPEEFHVPLEWGGKSVTETVAWFQYESDPSLNSNVYDVAHQLVQKHFPGEFGSERLVQKVVDTILVFTAQKPAEMDTDQGPSTSAVDHPQDPLNHNIPTKIILEGQQRQSIHKEHLNKSESEKKVRAKIQNKAPVNQKRKTDEIKKGPDKTQHALYAKHTASSPARLQVKQQKTLQTAEGEGRSQDQGSNQDHPQVGQGAVPKQKKVKVTTTDSRQLMLSLPTDVTYKCLVEQLSSELNLPESRMKIKCGFPPKVLQPPAEGQDKVLVIQHGDRLTLEVLPDSNAVKAKVPDNVWPAHQEPSNSSWSQFDAVAHDSGAQQMLKSLQQLQDTKSDSIDTSIASLALMATLQGKDLWNMVQTMPHLFSVGGLFYEQVKRDLGLADGKHCVVPALPGKVFRFSSSTDRLELCLEPHGHFPVAPGIEAQILNTSLVNMAYKQGIFPKEIGTGSSGVVVGKAEKVVGKAVAFQGQGHSLRPGDVDAQMPKELSPTRRNRAAPFRKLADSRENSIAEEEMDAEDSPDMSRQSGISATDISGNALEQESDLVREVISLANSLARTEGDHVTDLDNSPAADLDLANQIAPKSNEPLFRKVGPGYTVLDHKPAETSHVERVLSPEERQREFQNLTRNLEALVEESETESLQEPNNTVSLDPTSAVSKGSEHVESTTEPMDALKTEDT